jgi:DNA-binding NarL/FixJ family response regulator
MTSGEAKIRVLIVEDGDEYLHNFRAFLGDHFELVQAHDGRAACRLAREVSPDIVYLDMRFDRTPVEDLLGDLVALTERFNGDLSRARRFAQDNQGLYVLRALRESQCTVPAIISYDFSGEIKRFELLAARDPGLYYCPDYADAATIRATIAGAIRCVSGSVSTRH